MSRQHGISEQTLYRWKAKYGGLEGSDSRKLRDLQEENRKLMSMVAELSLANAFIESFHGRLRDECLNANWFLTAADARRKIQAWARDYNEARPHSGLGYLTPHEYAAKAANIARLL